MTPNALRHRRAAVLFALGAGVFLPGVAPADEAAERKEQARKLFVAGQAALNKGDKATGCAKMRESMELFAIANTLFNVARCEEGEGKHVAALEHWKRGLSLLDAKDARTPVVKKSITALENRLPRVRVVIPPKWAPITVLLDEEELPAQRLEEPIFVDPGKHVFVMRKDGREDRRVELVLNDKERTEVVAEPGEPLPAPVPTATASASASVAPPPPPPGNGLRTGAFVAFGAGAAGFIAAGVSGGMILSFDSKCRDKICPLDVYPDRGKQDTLLIVNTVGWGLGIAGVAAGAVMLVLSRRDARDPQAPQATVAPLVLPGGSGLGLSGRF